jgi:hypothetical protein
MLSVSCILSTKFPVLIHDKLEAPSEHETPSESSLGPVSSRFTGPINSLLQILADAKEDRKKRLAAVKRQLVKSEWTVEQHHHTDRRSEVGYQAPLVQYIIPQKRKKACPRLEFRSGATPPQHASALLLMHPAPVYYLSLRVHLFHAGDGHWNGGGQPLWFSVQQDI